MKLKNKAFFRNELKRLADLAEIERAVKGKTYPAGCTLIPLSASSKELIRYQDKAGEISSRYAVVSPRAGINTEYFYLAIEKAANYFFAKYQTGINLQLPILLKYFVIQYHEDKATQDKIAESFHWIHKAIENEQKELEAAQKIKKNLLPRMFV